MLETALKDQLRTIFAPLDSRYTFLFLLNPRHENRNELIELLEDVASCSEKINYRLEEGEGLEFELLKNEQKTRIKFRGIPNGHEFTSLLLAILNSDGKGKNIPDGSLQKRIAALKGPIRLTTYVSLTCTNCPDVVQALNLMAILNDNIEHEMVDGAINQAEVEARIYRECLRYMPTVSSYTSDGENSENSLKNWRRPTVRRIPARKSRKRNTTS